MLTECRKLKSVEVLHDRNAINVCWKNQILRDGLVASEGLERKSYSSFQRSEFVADVDCADKYLDLIDWQGKTPDWWQEQVNDGASLRSVLK